jgi:hypothetical protein
VIDILAWHPTRGVLLVIELKTEVVDVNEMLGTLDRMRRLAQGIARSRGWQPRAVGTWVVISNEVLEGDPRPADAAEGAGGAPMTARADPTTTRSSSAAGPGSLQHFPGDDLAVAPVRALSDAVFGRDRGRIYLT